MFDEKYQFLLANFPFEIGQKYCWRVTAYDPFEKATFLQNGKSEVRSFIYKHLPVPVTGLKHTINERNRQATVTWNAEEGHTKYYVEYYNPQTTKTIAMEKDEPKFTLASAPEKEYTILFRVKAQCWGDDSRCSNWSDWDTIKYAAPQIVEPKYPCGYQFPKVEITNFELKTDFKEGDIVSEANGSSDYEIINCKSDGNGVLQGQFYLIMNAWGGAKIACEFWDTKINTDNQIITTRYRSIDTPVGMVEPEELANYVKSLWLDGNSLATSSKIRDTIVINQKFDYLYRRESGEFVAVVVNDDGSTTETEFDLHKNPSQTLITDGKGDSLVYSQNGHLMGIKEYRATGGNAALLKDYHRKSDSLAQWKINFLPDTATQIYGFDYLGSGNHGIYSGSEYYPYLSANYDLRYKSVETGKTDKVIVDFGSYPEKDSVIFKDKYGVTLKLSKGNVLNFTGVAKPDTNYIYAYRGDQKIGKLSVNTYKQKTYKVVLVSVNGAKLPEIGKLEDYLNEVYKQSVVNFEISTDELTLNDLTSFSHGGSGVLTVYNDDQKSVLQAYDSQMQDGVYYLFFIDNVTDKKDGNGTLVSGYMPRGYNCGFIYDGGSEHTVAHELGHGIAGLEHVFENSNNSGKTANLMDYSSGEELWHLQWDAIQDPSRVWMKWNKDESEGEEHGDIMHLVEWNKLENEISGLFIAPSNLPIWIDNVVEVYTLKPSTDYGIALQNINESAIYGFVTAKRDTFLAKFNYCSDFTGFYLGDSLYVDAARKSLNCSGKTSTPFHFWDYNTNTFYTNYDESRVCLKYSENYCAVLKNDCVTDYNYSLVSDYLNKESSICFLYDSIHSTIVVVTGESDCRRLLKYKESYGYVKLNDLLINPSNKIQFFTSKEFAESEYNWLRVDMQNAQRDASKYVAVGMGVMICIPLLIEAGPVAIQQGISLLARKYGRDFGIGVGEQMVIHYIKWRLKKYLKSDTQTDFWDDYIVDIFNNKFSYFTEILEGGVNNCIKLSSKNPFGKENIAKEVLTCFTSINYGDLFAVEEKDSDKRFKIQIERAISDCAFNVITKPFFQAIDLLPSAAFPKEQKKIANFVTDFVMSIFNGTINDMSVDALKNQIENNIKNYNTNSDEEDRAEESGENAEGND